MFKTKFNPSRARSRRKQLGIGFLGLVFFAIVFGGLGLIGLKSFPIYSEYLKINRMVKKVAEENPKTAQEVAASFDRQSSIEDVSSIRGSDLDLDTKSGRAVISYKYSKRLPLVPPVSLVFDFEGSSR
jgi:Domain of unknown function (DUF4845)